MLLLPAKIDRSGRAGNQSSATCRSPNSCASRARTKFGDCPSGGRS
jgi:hypothetical protein